MPYSTLDDVRIAVGGRRSLVELADLEEQDPGDGGAGIAATVAVAIREADGAINSYLGQRFLVPVFPVPDSVRAMSAAWAARILRRNRYKAMPLVEDRDAEKTDREWLTRVSSGLVQLGIEPLPEKGSIVIDRAVERDSTAEISRCRLKDFI